MKSHVLVDLFAASSPVCVMVRATLENILSEERVNQIFEDTAARQYCRELTFATCVQLMTMVVARIRPSVNAAYRSAAAEVAVSVNSVYNKLKGIEPAVSERLVRDTAADMAAMIDFMGAAVDGPLPGREVRILDGNHLMGTEHRIQELRGLGAAALPGQTIPILDPQRRLIEDVIVWEDGHSHERALLDHVLPRIQARQCWIGDRAYCTIKFLFGTAQRKAHFVIRQHAQLQGELIGRRCRAGRCDSGMVYEQKLRIWADGGEEQIVRRMTIERDKPTKDGETEIHILTNLPASVTTLMVAEAYRQRWTIETAFQDVTTTLRCEINTLGYPDAALFGFSVALLMYNVLSVVQAALRDSQTATRVIERNVSMYAMADEISGVWRGMEIAIPPKTWTDIYAKLTPRQLVSKLRQLARKADLARYTTYKWSPKRPQPKRLSGNRGNHVSTQRILNQRKQS